MAEPRRADRLTGLVDPFAETTTFVYDIPGGGQRVATLHHAGRRGAMYVAIHDTR